MSRRQRTFIGPQAMGGLVSLWGQSSLIKSIQRGTITIAAAATSNTATITGVALENAVITWVGTCVTGGDANSDVDCARLELTNATTVTAYVNTIAAAFGRDVVYEVIEYMPGVIKSIQRGTYATVVAQTGQATITAVDTSKARLDNLGFTTTLASALLAVAFFKQVLTNATTIDGRGFGGASRTVGYQVVEFF